jgi:hypothetical protein
MIMPMNERLRKKKMGTFRTFSLVILAFYLISIRAIATELKSINLSMPTNYGTFFGEIHYQSSDLPVALRVERIIKEDLIKAINYFEYCPRDTVHFNIDPYLRITNGNARAFPTNIINLYNFPASNFDHLISMENWLQGLVFHEFIHIVQMDQTRDFLEFGRNIFGTVAKIPPSIVPRWFVEGIAVWGESHLIEGGRLNHALFNKELYLQFKNKNYCSTIDCLDTPGVYPHGSLAYWAGAHFLDYLEEKKPKTIKCLVELNSQEIPFFLSNVFEKCTDEKAQDLYSKFRNEFIAKFEKENSSSMMGQDKIDFDFGSLEFQKGMVLENEKIFSVQKNRYSEALVLNDFKNKTKILKKFEHPVAELDSIIQHNDGSKSLLASFYLDPQFRLKNKEWALVDTEKLDIKKWLKFNHDPSYLIALADDKFLQICYENNRWQIFRDNDLVYAFSPEANLSLIKKINDQIIFKVTDSYGSYELVQSDLDFKNLNVLFKNKKQFEIPWILEKQIIIKSGNDFKVISISERPTIADFTLANFERVTFVKNSKTSMVTLANELTRREIKEEDALKIIADASKNQTPIVFEKYQEQPAPKDSFASLKAENYPRPDHFLPHFWFLAFGSSENLSSIGAMTTLSDPMDIQTLNATALIYPSAKKVGGSVDYDQKMVKVDDLWKVSASLSQDYSKPSYNDIISSERSLSLTNSYQLLAKRWTYVPALTLSTSSDEDAFSKRSTNSITSSIAAHYQSLSFDDHFQSLNAGVSLEGSKPNLGSGFWSTLLTADATGRVNENLTATVKTAYEKLIKSDFLRGVAYGGGNSDFSNRRIHEFYGVAYGDVFGNEIFNMRETIDFNLWNIYRGKNFIPFFFKEAHIIAGHEMMYADYMVLDNTVYFKKMIHSIFMGPRLKANIFYFVPANIDLIISSIALPSGKQKNQVDFLFTADFF